MYPKFSNLAILSKLTDLSTFNVLIYHLTIDLSDVSLGTLVKSEIFYRPLDRIDRLDLYRRGYRASRGFFVVNCIVIQSTPNKFRYLAHLFSFRTPLVGARSAS